MDPEDIAARHRLAVGYTFAVIAGWTPHPETPGTYLATSYGDVQRARTLMAKARALNCTDTDIIGVLAERQKNLERLDRREFVGSWFHVVLFGLMGGLPGLIWWYVGRQPVFLRDRHTVEAIRSGKDPRAGAKFAGALSRIGAWFNGLHPEWGWAIALFCLPWVLMLLFPVFSVWAYKQNYVDPKRESPEWAEAERERSEARTAALKRAFSKVWPARGGGGDTGASSSETDVASKAAFAQHSTAMGLRNRRIAIIAATVAIASGIGFVVWRSVGHSTSGDVRTAVPRPASAATTLPSVSRADVTVDPATAVRRWEPQEAEKQAKRDADAAAREPIRSRPPVATESVSLATEVARANLIGTWTGTAVQPGANNFSVTLRLEGTGNGTVEYDSLRSRGTLTLLSREGGRFVFAERITAGQQHAIDGGFVALARGDDDSLVFSWYHKSRPETATARLERRAGSAVTVAPEQAEPHIAKGFAYLEQGDAKNAEASFRRALALDPDNAQAMGALDRMGAGPAAAALREGRRALAEEKFDAALQAFRRAGAGPEARQGVGDVLRAALRRGRDRDGKGDYLGAVEDLGLVLSAKDHLAPANMDGAEIALDLVDAAVGAGDLRRAKEALSALSGSQRQSPRAVLLIWKCAIAEHGMTAVRGPEFRQVQTLPVDVQLRLADEAIGRGEVALNRKQWNEAVLDSRIAGRLNGRAVKAAYLLGAGLAERYLAGNREPKDAESAKTQLDDFITRAAPLGTALAAPVADARRLLGLLAAKPR